MPLNLRQLSTPHPAFDGAVTFWMLPFRSLSVDVIITELERLDPKWEYTNTVTGECTHEVPEQYRKDIERAQAVNVPFASAWRATFLWTGRHEAFWKCDGATTDIEFHDTSSSTELKALEYYWQIRPPDIAERWDAFNELIGVNVFKAWEEAFQATRDTRMAAPVALQKPPVTDAEKKTTPKRKRPSSPK